MQTELGQKAVTARQKEKARIEANRLARQNQTFRGGNPVTLAEMHKEIQRENGLRRVLYPRWKEKENCSDKRKRTYDRQLEITEALENYLLSRLEAQKASAKNVE